MVVGVAWPASKAGAAVGGPEVVMAGPGQARSARVLRARAAVVTEGPPAPAAGPAEGRRCTRSMADS